MTTRISKDDAVQTKLISYELGQDNDNLIILKIAIIPYSASSDVKCDVHVYDKISNRFPEIDSIFFKIN